MKDARVLMKMRTCRVIEKRRHVVKTGNVRFEVDVFKGDHSGLVLAEIGLSGDRVQFRRPGWLGREVTGEKRYYNATLPRRREGC